MPQPMRYRAQFRPNFSPNALLERPQLAAHIGKIALMWTHVEQWIGHILAAMTRMESAQAMTIYASFVTANVRIDVLKAIAAERLDEPTQKLLVALLKDFRIRAGERNDVVHGIWGIDANRDDCLLHQDPTDHTLWITYHLYGRRPEGGILRKDEIERLPRVLVYKEKDFLAIEDRIQRLTENVSDMAHAVSSAARGQPPDARLSLRTRPATFGALRRALYTTTRKGQPS